MIARSKYLETEIENLQRQIDKLPEGKLLCARNGKYVKWYKSDGKKQVYIPKKDHAYAEQLAVKKYLLTKCEDLQQEKRASDAYLKIYKPGLFKSENLLLPDSPYKELLSQFFKTKSERIGAWLKEPFEQSKEYPEHCIQKSISGNMVRSKSESMIDSGLFHNKIPFRYEAALVLGGITLYPDFTILHPVTEEIFYWEHLGLLEKESYLKNACAKIQLYGNHGIILGVNLIVTTETKKHPLTMTKIERTIDEYLK